MLLASSSDRVELEPAVVVVQDRDDERQLLVAVDDLAEHVRGLVPVEGRAEHLDLVVRLEVRPRPARPLSSARSTRSTSRSRSANGTAPAEVAEHAHEAFAHAVDVRVVAAVDRRVGLDVLGRDRGADEDQVVVVVGAPQDPRDHRVEERLGELGLAVVDEEPDVAELRLAPGRRRRARRGRTRYAAARRTRERARRRSGSAPAPRAAPPAHAPRSKRSLACALVARNSR